MTAKKKYQSYNDYYQQYLTEHSSPVNQSLHFTGTFVVIVLLIVSVLVNNWVILLLIPIAGYGIPWIGHAFFEKNSPNLLKYPIWNIKSDFLMFWDILTFQLAAKLKKAQRKLEEPALT